jgi:hypothetical protein
MEVIFISAGWICFGESAGQRRCVPQYSGLPRYLSTKTITRNKDPLALCASIVYTHKDNTQIMDSEILYRSLRYIKDKGIELLGVPVYICLDGRINGQ